MNNLLDQRKLGILLGALIVLGVGIYFYQGMADKKEQEGKSALYRVQKTFEDESSKIPAAERAAGMPLDVDAKYSKTVSELNGMLTAKSASPRVLFEANLKLGTLYLDHAQAEKAVNALKSGSAFAKTALQKASLSYLLGVSHERANQFKEAFDAFQEGFNQNVEGLKGEFLLGMVRMSMKQNNPSQAKLFLEKMNKEIPGSKAIEVAQSLIEGGK